MQRAQASRRTRLPWIAAGLWLGLVRVGVCDPGMAASTAGSPPLAEVLAQHSAAMGGFAQLTSAQTMHARGRVELTGFPTSGTRESWFARPCRAREEIALGPLRMTAGVAAGVPWTRDMNGQVIVRRDVRAAREALTGCFLQGFDYLRPDTALVSVHGPVPVAALDGRTCIVLSLRGDDTELYIDPQSWLLVGQRGTEEGLESVSLFSDYREVQGIQMAFSEETRIPQVGQVLRTTWEEVEFNQPLSDSLFAVPRGQIRDFTFAAGRAAVTVPARNAGGLLAIDVSVGGDPPVAFLLDSGAGRTVLDSSYAAQLGLAMPAALPGVGAGEVARIHLVDIPPLAIEGLQLRAQSGAALPMHAWPARLGGIELRGILGFDFLSRFVTRIDYGAGTVTFCDPDSFRLTAPQESSAVVAAPLVMNVFTLTGRVNDVHEATFVLDTGAQVTLLGPELAARCGLVAGEGRRTDGFGVGGSEPFQLQAIGSLEIGGLRVDAPVVATQLREGGALQVLLDAVGGAGAGVLGSNVLQEFVVTLDYGEQRVILERAARR